MTMSSAPAGAAAAAPARGLRRVAIDPLSRVEGHGKVTLLLDEHNRVRQARLHIVEFRGFEAFVCGRPYWEVPVMVQRLCGICPVSHHLAASKALDAALGLRAVPAAAEAQRRLMHHGQILQSHALHFFHLSSPDLLFGFGSDAGRRHILAVAEAHPQIARQGVLLRQFGQDVIFATAGKKVHGTGSVPGGVNRALPRAERDALAARLPQVLAWCEQAVDLVARLHEADAPLYDGFGAAPMALMSLLGTGERDGALELYDGRLTVRDAAGAVTVDGADPAGYLGLIDEEVRPWSYMKFPYLRALGPEAGSYRVGPLARVQNCSRIATPRAEARRQQFRARAVGLQHGALATHWARMIEMLHAAEVIGQLLDDEALLGTAIVQPDRQHDAQQPGPARHGARGGRRALRRPRGDRRAAQPRRGRHPCLRPVPELRDARARLDAARGARAGRRRQRPRRPAARRRWRRARTAAGGLRG